MDAVVLVGGMGTRLRPLTLDTPKQMLPILERPMIVHVLEWLGRHGVSRAVLSLGYRPGPFLEAFPGGEVAGVRLAYAVEPEPLDTAGAVRFAARRAGVSATFLVLNGDVLTDIDAGELVRFHRERGASATIALTPVADPSAYGVVPTDESGKVTAFIEKPRLDAAPTNEINAGIYVLEPSVLDGISADRKVSIERETFPRLVDDGSLYALASAAYWLDTGTPAQYIAAQLDLLAGRREVQSMPPASEVSKGVFEGKDVACLGRVRGVAFLGDESSLSPGVELEDAVVGAGSSIEPGAVVRSSVLLDHARIGPGATVEHSVIGSGAVVGAGACVMAGSVVGNGAVVEAGSSLVGARQPAG